MHAKSSKDNYTSCDLFEQVFGPKQISVTSDWLRAYLNLHSVNFKYHLPGPVVILCRVRVCYQRCYHLIFVPLYDVWWLRGSFTADWTMCSLQLWARVAVTGCEKCPRGACLVPALGLGRDEVNMWHFSSTEVLHLMPCAMWLSSLENKGRREMNTD